jgi:hypothetical protein
MTPRYGQLTYTSFDSAGNAGGWRVKQTSGELSEVEKELLVANIRTVFRPQQPLPDYPSPKQLENAPRRLAYRRNAETGLYWHSVPAGTDSTGRPGNVFAHTVIDRHPDSPPGLRPIQRWRSPAWLRPYGSAAVCAAQLPVDAPAAGKAVTKDSVVAFACDINTWRLATVLGLLDAVAAALDGGAPVVLGAESTESAAQWIGLVSFLMSPGTAASLNFSTFDRGDEMPAALHAGQHLTAVPIGDLDELGDGVIVIDETATLSLGELGGQPHRTGGGQAIEVTAWSVLAQESLLDQASARQILDAIDTYAALTPDRQLHPAWPLAAAIASDAAFADAHPEAHAVLTAHMPSGIAADSVAADLVHSAFAGVVGDTTADAWKAAERNPTGPTGDYAAKTYLQRAMQDDTWLDQIGPIPVGAYTYHDRPVPPDLAAALGPALQRASAADPQRLLKLVDLLLRAGVKDERVRIALDGQVAAQLADHHAGPVLARRLAHRLSAPTRITAAAATLRRSGLADGLASVSIPVLAWLADGLQMPTPDELLRARPWDATWMRAAIRGAYAEQLSCADASADVDRFAQLWWVATFDSPRRDLLAASKAWQPEELLAAGGAQCSAEAILPTLVAASESAALQQLCNDILRANADNTAVAFAMVRRFDPAAWVTQGFFDGQLPGYVALWDAGLAQLRHTGIGQDFATRVAVLAALATIADMPRPACALALAANEQVAAAAAADLADLAERQVIPATALLAASLVGGDDASADTISVVLTAAADAVVAAGYLTENDEETVVDFVMQMVGADESASSERGYRKIVRNALARRHSEARPLLTARIRRSH